MLVNEKCKCNEEVLKLLDKQIAFHGNNFLNLNIYGLKRNFSQVTFNRLLNYKKALLNCQCLSKQDFNKLVEIIKTKV